jgi:hypothetical protein
LPAYASLGLCIASVFVPGLPTTVFILLAAYAAARGSERLHGCWRTPVRPDDPRAGRRMAWSAAARRAAYVGIACMASVAIRPWLWPDRRMQAHDPPAAILRR